MLLLLRMFRFIFISPGGWIAVMLTLSLMHAAGNATSVLTAMSGAASTCSSYDAINNFASSSLYSTISSFNDVSSLLGLAGTVLEGQACMSLDLVTH
jgi:hypothetical protein